MIIRNPTVEVCVVQILAIFGWWAEFGKVMGPFPAMFSRAVGFLSFVVLHKDWGSRRDNFPRLITGRISFHRSFVQPCFIVDPVSLNIYLSIWYHERSFDSYCEQGQMIHGIYFESVQICSIATAMMLDWVMDILFVRDWINLVISIDTNSLIDNHDSVHTTCSMGVQSGVMISRTQVFSASVCEGCHIPNTSVMFWAIYICSDIVGKLLY